MAKKRRRSRYDLDLDDLGLDLDLDFEGAKGVKGSGKGKKLIRVTKGPNAPYSYWRTKTPQTTTRKKAAAPRVTSTTGLHCIKFHPVLISKGPQKGTKSRRCTKYSCT